MTAPGLAWEIYDESLPFAGALYGPQRTRMMVVGLGGGELLAVSPGRPLDDEQWRALEGLGRPRFLLAPNHFHNAGLDEWQGRYPEARIVAHPAAHARLKKKVRGHAIHDLDVATAALPAHVRLFSPPGAKQGETWVSVTLESGRAWFVTDGIVNQEELPSGPVGWFMRAAGFRTELMNNPFFRRFFVPDWRAYCAFVLAELERDRPTMLVPSHGAVLSGPDLVERLRALVSA